MKALAALLFLAACSHENPPVTREVRWADPQTAALARRACYDCHSNETVWPWYASVPGVNFLIEHDTEEGREKMNFSTWDQPQGEAEEAGEEIEEGEMPLEIYVKMHPEAALSAAEKEQLIKGIEATFAADPPQEREGGEEGEEHEEEDDD